MRDTLIVGAAFVVVSVGLVYFHVELVRSKQVRPVAKAVGDLKGEITTLAVADAEMSRDIENTQKHLVELGAMTVDADGDLVTAIDSEKGDRKKGDDAVRDELKQVVAAQKKTLKGFAVALEQANAVIAMMDDRIKVLESSKCGCQPIRPSPQAAGASR